MEREFRALLGLCVVVILASAWYVYVYEERDYPSFMAQGFVDAVCTYSIPNTVLIQANPSIGNYKVPLEEVVNITATKYNVGTGSNGYLVYDLYSRHPSITIRFANGSVKKINGVYLMLADPKFAAKDNPRIVRA